MEYLVIKTDRDMQIFTQKAMNFILTFDPLNVLTKKEINNES